jgi:hypothetical protein
MSKFFLSIESFDPMNVDISFLDQVTRAFPREGVMDGPMAEEFATSTLAAADYCNDLLAQSIVYLGHCDSQRKAFKAGAIRSSVSNKVPVTIVKDVSVDDEQYIQAENTYNVALAWNSWLQSKSENLIKMHHLCKDFLRNNDILKGNSGWHGASRDLSEIEDDSTEDEKELSNKTSPWKV